MERVRVGELELVCGGPGEGRTRLRRERRGREREVQEVGCRVGVVVRVGRGVVIFCGGGGAFVLGLLLLFVVVLVQDEWKVWWRVEC